MLYCEHYSKSFVMTIQQAQQEVDTWIKTIGVRYFNELTNMAILTEEVGELSRHMARQYGEQSYRDDQEPPTDEIRRSVLGDEMADVLWVLLCMANQTGVDLEQALKNNFEKKNARDRDRHSKNNKLN